MSSAESDEPDLAVALLKRASQPRDIKLGEGGGCRLMNGRAARRRAGTGPPSIS